MTRGGSTVCILGSGPAAVSAGWAMASAACRIILVDAASDVAQPPPVPAATRGDTAAWPSFLGSDLRALATSPGVSPKLRTIAAASTVADYLSANRIIGDGFTAVGALSAGGLSTGWGAVAPAFDRSDLSECPIDLEALRPSYHRVAARIGLSGATSDDLSSFQGDGFALQPPLPPSGNARSVLDRYESRRARIASAIGRPRLAVLSETLADRQSCDLLGRCFWGCPRQSIYDSRHDLRGLMRSGHVERADGRIATALRRDGGRWRVELTDRDGRPADAIEADIVILAAGTLASTRLALDAAAVFDRPVPLTTNPAIAFAVWNQSRLGAAVDARTFGLAQLAMRVPLGESYAYGLLYEAATMPLSDLIDAIPLSRSGARKLVRGLLSSLLVGLVYLPGSLSAHRARLERQSDGLSHLRIEGRFAETYDLQRQAVMRVLRRDFRRLGMLVLPGSERALAAGADAHYAGTLAEREDASASRGILGLPGLVAVDGSVLTGLPAKNPTFSIMANADRIGRSLTIA